MDPFHISTCCQATSEGMSRLNFLLNFFIWIFGIFFLNLNSHFVFFWLRIWCESLVWVFKGRRGISQNASVLVVLVKAWSSGHKDHYKWKRSDSPCNTGCITVFRKRFKHMRPRAVNKVGREIYIAFSWALMRIKRRPILLFYNQPMDEWRRKMSIHNISEESLGS